MEYVDIMMLRLKSPEKVKVKIWCRNGTIETKDLTDDDILYLSADKFKEGSPGDTGTVWKNRIEERLKKRIKQFTKRQKHLLLK